MRNPSATVRKLLALGAGAALLLFLAACTQRDPDGDGPADPAESAPAVAGQAVLATIGGAQDVWPFSFGLDAERAIVESVMVSPKETRSRPAGTDESGAVVVTWDYPGVSFTFYIDEAAEVEDLLAARVYLPDIQLPGGLAIGMTEAEALELLGEPGHRADDDVVFFYYSTTIELVVIGGLVTEIALARALP